MERTKRNERGNIAAAFALAAIVALGANAVPAADLDGRHAWTAVGAAGVVDDDSQGQVRMNRGAVELRAGIMGSAIIRYNVNATDALIGTLGAGQAWELKVAYRAGANDRVQVFLMQRDIAGGAPKAVAAFDSDTRAPSGQMGPRLETEQESGLEFDFLNKVYCLAVILTREGPGQGPAFQNATLAPTGSGS